MSRFVPWIVLPLCVYLGFRLDWVLVEIPLFVLVCSGSHVSHIFSSHRRVRPWRSRLERRPTWSARPSHQRRASTVFSVLRLWPAWTNFSLPINPVPSAASPRDSYTFPARQSCSPPPLARTSPRAAPSCEYCWDHAGGKKKKKRKESKDKRTADASAGCTRERE